MVLGYTTYYVLLFYHRRRTIGLAWNYVETSQLGFSIPGMENRYWLAYY